MSAADRLDQIEARANAAATEGPWMRMGTNNECYIVVQESGDLLAVQRLHGEPRPNGR